MTEEAESYGYTKSSGEVFERLRAPFPASDLQWRVQASGTARSSGRPWLRVVAYVDSRAIQRRLDEVLGQLGWQTELKPVDGGILCGLSISNVAPDGRWVVVTKWDGSGNTKVEPIKGGISGALKRAAAQWGIGRYLYDLEATFAEVVESGGRYRSKVGDKQVEWNPPPLPSWAVAEEDAPPAPDPITDEQQKELDGLIIELGLSTEQRRKWQIEDTSALTAARAERGIAFLRNKLQGEKHPEQAEQEAGQEQFGFGGA